LDWLGYHRTSPNHSCGNCINLRTQIQLHLGVTSSAELQTSIRCAPWPKTHGAGTMPLVQ
jgi:hypothetical protein